MGRSARFHAIQGGSAGVEVHNHCSKNLELLVQVSGLVLSALN